MTNLTADDVRRSTRRNLDQLRNEVTAALALLAMAPDVDWRERVEVGEKLMLCRALLADASAVLDNEPVTT